MSCLDAPAVHNVLEDIVAADQANRAAADARFRAARPTSAPAIAEIYRDTPLNVPPPAARTLYVLARCSGAATIVEFGMSFAYSTIHLAAAARDSGEGRLITTELDPEKARTGKANLRAAGLADLVEVRIGDACDTLRELRDPIDLLFLDGLNALYVPVLRMLEPLLRAGAVVAADRSAGDSDWPRYRDHVREATSGYVSGEAGRLELSVRAVSGAPRGRPRGRPAPSRLRAGRAPSASADRGPG